MSLAHQAKGYNPQKVAMLKDRALMFSKARIFFAKKNVIEVDCNAMSPYASVDAHIDLIKASFSSPSTHYLHSSPEYGMKKLLSEGVGDIYQLSHVFRDDVSSPRHSQEFTMAEWYRVGMPFSGMVEETIDFIREFLGELPFSILTYREAFLRFAGFDYVSATIDDLQIYMQKNAIAPYEGIELEGKDGLLDMILGIVIQPNLGKDELLALQYFPASQSLLAETKRVDDEEVAVRFEVYYKGMELANGFLELTDSEEQSRRLAQNNIMRDSTGRDTLPIDQPFLDALKNGIPNCSGVAVGFDRLMMLRNNKDNIADVVP